MVVTVTMTGYIKRTPLALFREQKRGGKGRSGMSTKDEDIVTELFVTSTHNPVLFFSNIGRVYRMKVWRLPEGGPTAKGRPMVNLLPLAEGETITTVLPLPAGRGGMGRPAHHVRHRQGNGPAQLDGCLHQHPDRRQDRDEVRHVGRRRGRGRQPRPDHRRRAADRRATTSCSPRATARRSASCRPTCANSRAARRWAFAASGCRATTRSFPCRSSAASARRRRSARPISAARAWREKDEECTLAGGALRRDCRRRAVPADGHRKRLWQALVDL